MHCYWNTIGRMWLRYDQIDELGKILKLQIDFAYLTIKGVEYFTKVWCLNVDIGFNKLIIFLCLKRERYKIYLLTLVWFSSIYPIHQNFPWPLQVNGNWWNFKETKLGQTEKWGKVTIIASVAFWFSHRHQVCVSLLRNAFQLIKTYTL